MLFCESKKGQEQDTRYPINNIQSILEDIEHPNSPKQIIEGVHRKVINNRPTTLILFITTDSLTEHLLNSTKFEINNSSYPIRTHINKHVLQCKNCFKVVHPTRVCKKPECASDATKQHAQQVRVSLVQKGIAPTAEDHTLWCTKSAQKIVSPNSTTRKHKSINTKILEQSNQNNQKIIEQNNIITALGDNTKIFPLNSMPNPRLSNNSSKLRLKQSPN